MELPNGAPSAAVFTYFDAWVSENRLCIGQEKVEEKSNEITAIPKVLASLDLIDVVVSIDAIGTQTKIAGQIIDQKGHNLLSVKGNQQGLLEDVEHAFRLNKGTVFTNETESNHGRIENCKVYWNYPTERFLPM
ncbi:hypothetical protein EZS27_021205 [termite gut metagenome]|uniref:Transposase IS4-like domain-containing protein n=1 Tax=termite gut metagenome TaxID=433724 RepID=A0A5J4RAA1_9ZZZZ